MPSVLCSIPTQSVTNPNSTWPPAGKATSIHAALTSPLPVRDGRQLAFTPFPLGSRAELVCGSVFSVIGEWVDPLASGLTCWPKEYLAFAAKVTT